MVKRLAAVAALACAVVAWGATSTSAQSMEGAAVAQDQRGSQWYAFQPAEDVGPSVIGMEQWLDAPAGKHGPVLQRGDRFVFADGTPVPKLWGVNLGNMDCAPLEKEHGAKWAAFHAKYGVNAVRLHKFIGPGNGGIGDDNDSTKLDPAKTARFDDFVAECRNRGMYFGFSWIFDHKLRPGDKARLTHFDEIMTNGGDTSRVAVFVDPEVQQLRIDMLKVLLAHRNPHTGLTYAEDPALAFIELHNEDSIFFYTFSGLAKYPKLRAQFTARFNEWLTAKYRTHDALVAAWGPRGLNALETKDESLDRGNIALQPNPWFFSPDGLKQGREQGTERRWLDTAAFLYEQQTTFYKRFEQAIRDAGYKGPIVGSCWTTPAGVPQYLNLHSDYAVGFVDRHTYFGGAEGWQAKPGPFDSGAQVDVPGSGLLSQGFLQVQDRPFALSEWTTVFPNEHTPESNVIVAAYGLGLQGWDASYHFASHINEYDGRMFASRVNDPRLWVTDLPTQLGLFPALTRMLYRGDVTEGPVISTRRVSLGELVDGKPQWLGQEVTKQTGDIKEFRTALAQASLAAGRVLVEFTDAPAESTWPEMAKYVTADGAVRSATNELTWHPAKGEQRGYFTIDTKGTNGAVGFLPAGEVKLGDVMLASDGGFVTLLVTATEKDRTLADSRSILVTLVGRARNSGMEYAADGKSLVTVGEAPVMLEGVRVDVSLPKRKVKVVHVLDHDGRRTGRTLAVTGGPIRLDTAAEPTMYFELESE